jgi:cytochrome bd-type quinol oxidase subunit 2
MYVPLFGQRLAHLSPVAAGFLGAGLAIGWTSGEIASASLRDTRRIVRVVRAAPPVMAVGLALGAVAQSGEPSPAGVALWAVALVITGAGVGVAWPHLSAWAMMCVDDPAEGPAAAAAINTVQLICGAFGAGFAGMVVNLNESSDTSAASWLFASFAVLAGSATVAAVRAGGRPGPDRTAQ